MADEERKDQAAVYVVQVRTGEGSWVDLAVVTVPARTRRDTVLRRGLLIAGRSPKDGRVEARVLDASSARVITLEPDMPAEPGWREAAVVDAVAEHLGLGDESGKSLYPGDVS